MDWWTSMNKTDRQLIRYKKIKEATTRFPTWYISRTTKAITLIYYFFVDKKKIRDRAWKKTEHRLYTGERLEKRLEKIEENFFLYFPFENWNVIENLYVIAGTRWLHALFSEDRFKFPWQILYNLVWMTQRFDRVDTKNKNDGIKTSYVFFFLFLSFFDSKNKSIKSVSK